MKTFIKGNVSGFVLSILLISTGFAKAVTYTSAVSSGNWSNASSWTTTGSGGSPVRYIIQAGHTITMNLDVSGIDTLFVQGTLNMGNNKLLTMNFGGIIIFTETGVLENGSNNTEIHYGTSSSLFISGPFTSTNIISGGPRFGTYATMVAANGDPQGSFPVALPVELKTVDIVKAGDDYNLTWTALGESNLNVFTIEISDNGKDYHLVGTTEGNQESYEGHYSFRLVSPDHSIYVRLSMVTKNSISQILATKFIETDDQRKSEFMIFPTVINPSSSDLKIVVPDAGDYQVSIFCSNGQLAVKTQFTTNSSSELENVPLNGFNLNSGTYYLILTGDNVKHQSTLLIQR